MNDLKRQMRAVAANNGHQISEFKFFGDHTYNSAQATCQLCGEEVEYERGVKDGIPWQKWSGLVAEKRCEDAERTWALKMPAPTAPAAPSDEVINKISDMVEEMGWPDFLLAASAVAKLDGENANTDLDGVAARKFLALSIRLKSLAKT